MAVFTRTKMAFHCVLIFILLALCQSVPVREHSDTNAIESTTDSTLVPTSNVPFVIGGIVFYPDLTMAEAVKKLQENRTKLPRRSRQLVYTKDHRKIAVPKTPCARSKEGKIECSVETEFNLYQDNTVFDHQKT